MAERVGAEELGAILGTAIEAALAAGRLLLNERESAINSIDTKRHMNDLVTAADKAAEKLIVDRIKYDHPDHGIIGEEGERTNPDSRTQWVIDPLDGTTNYVHGSGPYAVSIGVERDGVPIVGVIHVPATGETFSAAQGCGAFNNNERLSVSGATDLDTAVVGFDGPQEYMRDSSMKLAGTRLRAVRSFGSCAVAMAWVAAGRLDAFWIRNVGHWDISAGVVIIREAGGWVGAIDGSDPTPQETVGASPGIAEALRSVLAP